MKANRDWERSNNGKSTSNQKNRPFYVIYPTALKIEKFGLYVGYVWYTMGTRNIRLTCILLYYV